MSTASQPISSGAPWPPLRWLWRGLAILAALLLVGLFIRSIGKITKTPEAAIPTAKVRRGDLSLRLTARGELRGGNPTIMIAPMTGGGEMHIISLVPSGSEVKTGELVVQLNTGDQELKLKEAQADLAEAEQHLVQATAQREADKEEDDYALTKARSDLKIAELDVRKNPIVAAIVARQNDLAVAQAKDHLAQLEHNIANRQGTNAAAIAIQEAARAKAQSQMKTAHDNIEAMSLRAPRPGYVSIKPSSPNFITSGMVIPPLQVGDTVRPGMALAEIPDLDHWELSAKMDETDRGHIAVGDNVEISVIAIPERKYKGKVKDLGGTTGPFWERHFECMVTLEDPTPALRPGMSALLVLTTDEMRNVLWLPAQALFETNGRTFVYARAGKSFAPKDVKLVRRNETKAVITGLNEGQEVALSNPLDAAKKKEAGAANPLKSVAR